MEWLISPTNALSGKGCPACAREGRYNSNARTHSDYVDELLDVNPNIVVMEPYINARTKILHKCLIHNIEWSVAPDIVLHGHGCPQCHNERISKSKTHSHEWYVDMVSNISPHIRVIGKYIGGKKPIAHYCTLHDYMWNTDPQNILAGHGCDICKREKIAEKQTKPLSVYQEELALVNPDIICVGEYECATRHVQHKCLICGKEWDATPSNILFGTGCPYCNKSHGERIIQSWLDEYNIHYTTQKKYDDCVDVNPLPFDFYLPDYDILIEYDGIQHFQPVDFFGGQQAFEKLVYHDHIKTDYCLNNHIDLLRIPYYKDIETELNNYILTQ